MFPFSLSHQRDQLASHEEQVTKLENTITEHKQGSVPTKGLALQNYREKEAYLQYEVRPGTRSTLLLIWLFFLFLALQLKRYKTYVYLLSSHINSNPSDNIISIIIGANNSTPTTPTLGEEDELKPLGAGANHQNDQQGTNRYSYRAAIYRSDSQDIGWRVMGVFSACVV